VPFDIARKRISCAARDISRDDFTVVESSYRLTQSLSSPKFRCRCHCPFVSYRSIRPFLFLTLAVVRNELNDKTTGLATEVDVDAASDFCDSQTTRAGQKLHKSF